MPGVGASAGGHNAQFDYNGQTFEMPGYGSSRTNRYVFGGTEYPSLAAVRAAIDRHNKDTSFSEAQRAQGSGMGFVTDEYGRTTYRNGPGGGGGSGSGGGGGTGAGGGAGTGVDFASAYSSIPDTQEPWISGPSAGDNSAALTASYARAKERAGLEAQGGAKSIRALMARRGLAGSKFALGQEAKAIRGGQAMLGEYGRDESLQLARRNAQTTDMTYGGSIQQRAQNIGAKQNRTNQALSLAALQQRSA